MSTKKLGNTPKTQLPMKSAGTSRTTKKAPDRAQKAGSTAQTGEVSASPETTRFTVFVLDEMTSGAQVGPRSPGDPLGKAVSEGIGELARKYYDYKVAEGGGGSTGKSIQIEVMMGSRSKQPDPDLEGVRKSQVKKALMSSGAQLSDFKMNQLADAIAAAIRGVIESK